MSESFAWVFLIIIGSFLFGILFYGFYIGLKPKKKKQLDDVKKQNNVHKSKAGVL